MKTNQITTLALSATAACVFAAGSSVALPIIEESFDYDTGDLNGNGVSTTGLTGNWGSDNRYDVDSGTIIYGNLESSGNKMGINNGGSGMHRVDAAIDTTALANANVMGDNDTLWFSFLITTYEASGDDSFIVALATDKWNPGESAQPGQAVGFYMLNGGSARAQFWNSNSFQGSPSGSTDLIPNTWTGGESATQLIVGRLDWGEDGVSNDTLSLYNVGTDLVLPGSAFSTASFDATQSNFDLIALTGRNGLIVDLDEVRFGATYADVTPIPEPGSLALLGLGGVLIAARRRRD